MPPPPHVIELLKTASNNSNVADVLAKGFDSPSSLFPWILSPEATHQKILEHNSHITETTKPSLTFN